jgi:hypothetical protein
MAPSTDDVLATRLAANRPEYCAAQSTIARERAKINPTLAD